MLKTIERKRVFPLLVLVFALVFAMAAVMGSLALPATAHAAEKSSGYWQFTKSEVVGPEYPDYFDGVTMSGGNGTYKCDAVQTDDRMEAYHGSDRKTTCVGETVNITITVSEPTMTTLKPGQELSMQVGASFSTSSYYDSLLGLNCTVRADIGYEGSGNSQVSFSTSDGKEFLGIDRTWEANDYYGHGGKFFVINESGDQVFRAKIPESMAGKNIWVGTKFGHGRGEDAIGTYYYYDWVDASTPAAVTSQESSDKDESGSSASSTDASGKSEGSTGKSEESSPKQDVVINTEASKDKGDSGGWVIPAAIIGALLVAIGAIVLSRRGRKGDLPPDDDSGPTDDGQQEESSSTFRMVLWKDFGDCLRVGADPQTVGARIEELRTNLDNTVTVIERDDLTELIEITSGRYAHVVPSGMSGRHMTAQVDIPRGTVIDALESEVGAFTSNAAFRIVGEPRITFPELTEDGAGWNEAVWLDVVRMVAGAGGAERLRFVIADAPDEPTEINFTTSEALDVSDEKDAQLAFTYYACIENRTAPMEKESGIFAEKRDAKVDVQAVFADGTVASSSFTVELWPDGLSARVDEQDKKDGRLLVNTLPDKLRSPDSLSSEIKPTYFSLAVCYVGSDGASVILENPSVSYAKTLDDDGEYGIIFSYNFDYDVHAGSKYCTFNPQDMLPMTSEPYHAALAISAQAGDRSLDAVLPLALVGETPRKPSSVDWDQAFQRLKKDIELFGIGDASEIREILRDPYVHSAAELEFARYWILLTGVYFYQQEQLANQRMADLYSKYITISSSLVKAGDYAIEYILVAYWGKTAGKTAACFINPFKNMLYTYIGEAIAVGGWEKADLKFMETLLEGCQNALAEGLTGVLKPASPEDLGYVVAAYMMTSFSKHYWHGDDYEKGDVFRSVIAACADLGMEKFKEFLSTVFEKMWDVVGEWFGKLFKSYFSIAAEKAAEVAKSQAFEGAMRDTVKKGAVETKDLLFARSTGALAYEAQKESILREVELATDGLTKIAVNATDITLGAVLNYLVGGNLEENKALGLSTMDVLIGFLENRLKIKARPVYGAVTNPWDISFRLDKGLITASILGFTVEIPLLENSAVIWDMVFDYGFEWMKVIFETAVPPAGDVPDKRDLFEENLELVVKTADDLKRLKPITYKGWKGYHGIGADEQMDGQ